MWNKKPDSSGSSFPNESTLLKIGESGDQPTFNGVIIGGSGGGSEGAPVRFQKWTALGDSITQAPTFTPYHTFAGTALGIPTVVNRGMSGTTIANINANAMVFRYTGIPTDSDLISVLGGTNDWNMNVPLGVISDSVNTTFYGALNIMCAGLINLFKNATIFFMTPLQRSNGGNANGIGLMLTAYCDAIIEVCEKYSIPVLDMYRKGNFYPINAGFSTTYTSDGLHPNTLGHQRLSYPISGYIRTL